MIIDYLEKQSSFYQLLFNVLEIFQRAGIRQDTNTSIVQILHNFAD
jgi:hypothetical protein